MKTRLPLVPRSAKTLAIATIAVLLIPSTSVATMFLELAGSQQGPIPGDAGFSGETGAIEVLSFEQNTYHPYDPSSGLVTGARIIGPLVITKPYDRATVRMVHALSTLEEFSVCQLRAWRVATGGAFEHYLTVDLSGAVLLEQVVSHPDPNTTLESWVIGFESITWTDEIHGVQYTESFGSTSVDDPLARGGADLSPLPNPTSGRTSFRFRLPDRGHVRLNVFDLRGRLVAEVFDGTSPRSEAVVEWDGLDADGAPVAQGVYLVRMQSEEGVTTRKLAVVR